MMPGKNGGMLRRGSLKGNTPGTGRPTDEFRAKMRSLVGKPEVEKTLTEALEAPATEDHFWKALNYATDHGHGKPEQKSDVSVTGLVEILAMAAKLEPAD